MQIRQIPREILDDKGRKGRGAGKRDHTGL